MKEYGYEGVKCKRTRVENPTLRRYALRGSYSMAYKSLIDRRRIIP